MSLQQPSPNPLRQKQACSLHGHRSRCPSIPSKPENRGPILRLSAEDHYTMTVTSRGRELILIRFSDALSELAETEGTQIHRSHWIARAAFEALAQGTASCWRV